MRYIIALIGLWIVVHSAPSLAGCLTPQTCTADTAALYLGGAPWEVRCELEDASWDPQQRSVTCVGHSRALESAGGVPYVEMEYATVTASGAVWPYLPMWVTYWWPTPHAAQSWLAAYSVVDLMQTERRRGYSYCDEIPAEPPYHPAIPYCVTAILYDDGSSLRASCDARGCGAWRCVPDPYPLPPMPMPGDDPILNPTMPAPADICRTINP